MNELRGSPREWLQTGWILEIPRGFLIGGGTLRSLTFEELERASCAVWAPAFFPDSFQSIDRPAVPMESVWSENITRDELLAWLSGGATAESAMTKISWRSPDKAAFLKAFARIQRAFREEGVKKAVPAIFASGIGATDDRIAWILNRVRAGLAATSKNDLRLYGMWSEKGGFIGATPEALFTRELDNVTSMAVAGTRAINSLGYRRKDPDAINEMTRNFLQDPKERHEHEIVALDIQDVLETAGAQVEKSEMAVERFGSLFHLVSHLKASFSQEMKIKDLVTALHPTPALGVSPRDPDLKLLREVHEIAAQGIAREGFGAPFVVKNEERVEAVVAIRQLRWTFSEGDRIRVVVGSGAGIVPESDPEREWTELENKRRAVMRLFRLTTEQPEPVLWSLSILEKLLAFGVRKFIVCAGARNAPLVVAAEALRQAAIATSFGEDLSVESFFEERAAAFYALGLARGSGAPVAVLTTSGTAATELQAAIAEADFSGVPLIAVTADRPRRLRKSGAPQSIPQNGMFDRFVECSWDVEEGDLLEGMSELSRHQPLHINVCLEEPLLADAERDAENLSRKAQEVLSRVRVPVAAPQMPPVDHSASFAALNAMVTKRVGLVAIVGSLAPHEREAVAAFLKMNSIPCLLEGPSGLRGDPRLRHLELCGGERELQALCVSGELSSVLRLGSVPTTRVWRDLDDSNVATQTLSISSLRFSGLGRGQFVHLSGHTEFSDFLKRATPNVALESTALEKQWLDRDRIACERLEAAVKRWPNSEPACVRAVSELIPAGTDVYVGNSLPVRWWDLVASRDHVTAVDANRGVNGIDGQLSTALGLAAARVRDAWILLGDLTTLYDLAAPWALRTEALKSFAKSGRKLRIVVINNSGGRIFTRVLAKAPGGAAPFENNHDLGFEHWAGMWKLSFARVTTAAEISQANAKLSDAFAVIEIVPTATETAEFWQELAT